MYTMNALMKGPWYLWIEGDSLYTSIFLWKYMIHKCTLAILLAINDIHQIIFEVRKELILIIYIFCCYPLWEIIINMKFWSDVWCVISYQNK